jgi:tRNA modification GTPase
MLTLDDTIAAVASAPGGAARGIVRLSGPDIRQIISRCFQASDAALDWKNLAEPTVISGRFKIERSSSAERSSNFELPADIFLWPTARSYTRQPLAEIHTLGSPPLLQAVLQAVCTVGARLANPGEFTLRAFLAGRIDLTQAEAVLGVIDAADRRQLRAALDQLAGGLSRPLHQLRSELLNLLADLEAGLDFVEDDIRFVTVTELQNQLKYASGQLEDLLYQLSERAAGVELPRVVLVGWPNVGKSSLFNALIGDPAALVSPQAGTTRDYLTAHVNAAGISIELIDTAGVASNANELMPADVTAQTFSANQHQQANLCLFCLDATRPLNPWEQTQLADSNSIIPRLVVLTKSDQPSACVPDISVIPTSSHTGVGLEALRAAIAAALSAQPNDLSVVVSTADRARDSIRAAFECLSRARQLCDPNANYQTAEELVAAELRTALAELGKVVGAIYTDDLLDRIFSRFCIGK